MALLKLYKMRMACWNLPLDITLAHNGYEALMHVGRDSPDMFIADLCMPGIDGLQMLRNLATSRFREGMEIVVVTGMNPADLTGLGGLPPSVRSFCKPVPFADLRLLTEQLLARRAEV
jgi:CheY-like chemotaxis protein